MDKNEKVIYYERKLIAYEQMLSAYREPNYSFPQFLSCLYREIREFDNFKQWVFGHYHQDKNLDSRTRVIYNDIIELK